MPSLLTLGPALALALLGQASLVAAGNDGFFHTGSQILVQESADPIVSPGKRSGHVHSVFGGNAFALSLKDDSFLGSTCTTNTIAQDKSAYWIPRPYFHHRNGSFLAIDPDGMGLTVYYDYKKTDKPFPTGFRMLVGKPTARSKYTIPNAPKEVLQMECLGGQKFLYDGFPTEPCPARVRSIIHFPTCGWANQSLDSPDHSSHVAYKLPSGKCPDTHPIGYPELHYEIYWSNAGVGQLTWDQGANPSQPWVFASGDPTGYGLHGDFFNGWDDTLANAMDQCNGSGGSGACSLFRIQDDAAQKACRKKGNSPDLGNNEEVLGPLTKLPGCNPITTTEAAAIAASKAPCSDQDAPPPVLSKVRRHNTRQKH